MSTPSLSEHDLLDALARVIDPLTQQDFVSSKALRNLLIVGADVSFEIELGYPAQSLIPALHQQLESAARSVAGVGQVSINIHSKVVSHSVQRGVKLMEGVRNVIAVASGKGGVGKSTTAVNLALALAAEGARVGLLDADIYGPSQPTMTGTRGKPETLDGKLMEPKLKYGLQINSIGFLVSDDQAMVWRGPMASQALEQLIMQTRWQDLDYLIVDMPP
ncbi:MAG: P-loop NTPase, partial [Betaproteobacteria bacterium]